jgi:hypothetical protein
LGSRVRIPSPAPKFRHEINILPRYAASIVARPGSKTRTGNGRVEGPGASVPKEFENHSTLGPRLK